MPQNPRPLRLAPLCVRRSPYPVVSADVPSLDFYRWIPKTQGSPAPILPTSPRQPDGTQRTHPPALEGAASLSLRERVMCSRFAGPHLCAPNREG